VPDTGWSPPVIKRFGTVRAVTTAVATLFVAIALVVGATVLIAALRQTLIDEVEEAARVQALEVAHQLEAGRPPVLEVAGSRDEQLIQLTTPAGAVVGSSPNVAGEPVVARLAPGQSMRVVTPLDDDEFIAVAEGANTADGLRVVVVARALIGVYETTTVVTRLLVVGLPLLLVVVAVTTWFVVGRALAPVEAIRREVDEISAAQLHRRVPQPATDDEIGRLAATMNRMLARLENARDYDHPPARRGGVGPSRPNDRPGARRGGAGGAATDAAASRRSAAACPG
jgi:HAMP domain-containing protein